MPQSYTRLLCHVIFGTKNHTPVITPDILDRLYAYIGGIVANENGRLLVAGGTSDHVHLLLSLHPQAAVADVVRLVKTNSSKWVHETFPDVRDFAWQPGYGAFSVSQSSLNQVQRYIESQQAHHRRVSFQEEFAAFLKRHGVPFDDKYLWK